MKPCTSSPNNLPSIPTPVYAEDIASATTLTLLPATVSKHYQVYGFVISTDTAGDYTLSIGSEVVGRYFFGATAGLAISWVPFYLSTGIVNQAVTLTKPSGAKTAVTTFAGLV